MRRKFDPIFLFAPKVVKRVMRLHPICMEGEWATKCTNAACALEVLLMFLANAVSTCFPSCVLGFDPSDGGHVRLSVSLCLIGDKGSPAMLRISLWLLVRKVATAHVARMVLPDLVAYFTVGQEEPLQTMVQEHMHKD